MTELPKGWSRRRLADVATVILGQSPPGSSYNADGLGYPFFQGKTEFGDLHPTVRKWTTAGTKFAEPGDVLVSVRAPVGPTNVTLIPCAIGRGLAALRAGADIDPQYLLHVMRGTEQALASKATGTTFEAISGAVLRDHLIPVPPLDEQRRIVTILEDHLSRLDAAVHALDAVELKARLLLASAFEACASPMQGKRSDEPWQTLRFGDIASIDADLRDPKDYSDWPHIAPNHIEKDTGRLLEYKTIGEDGVTSPKHAFRSGQILYSKIRPYLNKVALPNFDGLCSADMYPISTGQDVEWLYYAMLSPSFVRKTSGTQNRTVLPKINAGALRAVEVMVPPARQQVGLRLMASEVARAVERIESSVAVARTRANTLRGALLRVAFSGQFTKEAESV